MNDVPLLKMGGAGGEDAAASSFSLSSLETSSALREPADVGVMRRGEKTVCGGATDAAVGVLKPAGRCARGGVVGADECMTEEKRFCACLRPRLIMTEADVPESIGRAPAPPPLPLVPSTNAF